MRAPDSRIGIDRPMITDDRAQRVAQGVAEQEPLVLQPLALAVRT